jgi:hypothetical protein
MEKSDVEDIVGKVRDINLAIAIYRANRNSGGKLIFDQM